MGNSNDSDINDIAMQSLHGDPELYNSAENRGRDDLFLGQGVGAESAGRMATGAEIASGLTPQQRRQQKDKSKAAFQAAADLASQQLAKLQAELDTVNAAIEANDMLGHLLRTGQFDRSNQDHADLIVAAGLDPTLDDADLTEAQRERAGELNQEKDRLQTDIATQRQADGNRLTRNSLFKNAKHTDRQLTETTKSTLAEEMLEQSNSLCQEFSCAHDAATPLVPKQVELEVQANNSVVPLPPTR